MAGQAKTAETGVQAGKESTLWRKLARVYVGTTVVAAFMISGVHPSVTLYPVPLLGLYDARGADVLSVDQSVERLWRTDIRL